MGFIKKKIIRNNASGFSQRIRPVFEDFHKLTVTESCEYQEHRHYNYELIVVDSGPYTCNLNNREISLQHGQFLIIKPGDSHQDHFNAGQEHFVLHFKIVSETALPATGIRLFSHNIDPREQVGVVELKEPFLFFETLQAELEQEERFTYYIQDSMLETFFWKVIRLLPQQTLSDQVLLLNKQFEFQSQLSRLFADNISGNLTVDEMTEHFGMSKRAFSYKCKELLNQSPAKAFAEYKVYKAAEELVSSGSTIQEVSHKFGFPNQFQFSRTFKRVMGCSPKKYLSR